MQQHKPVTVFKTLDIANFYRIKLTSHFGTNNVNQIRNEENIGKCPSNKKKKKISKNTHLTIQTFIETTSWDIDIEKPKQEIFS